MAAFVFPTSLIYFPFFCSFPLLPLSLCLLSLPPQSLSSTTTNTRTWCPEQFASGSMSTWIVRTSQWTISLLTTADFPQWRSEVKPTRISSVKQIAQSVPHNFSKLLYVDIPTKKSPVKSTHLIVARPAIFLWSISTSVFIRNEDVDVASSSLIRTKSVCPAKFQGLPTSLLSSSLVVSTGTPVPPARFGYRGRAVGKQCLPTILINALASIGRVWVH